MGKEELTDLGYLREVAMGDEEIVIETTEAFLSDLPEAIDNIRSHFANQEWHKLHRQTHKIKPSFKYMGMERAWELITEIEKQARTEEITEDLGSKIKEFYELCDQAMGELSDKIKKLKSA